MNQTTGTPVAAAGQGPGGYGGPPQGGGYGGPPQGGGYGGPPQGGGYGGPPQGGGFGGPPQGGGFGGPPNPYGGPPNPYGAPNPWGDPPLVPVPVQSGTNIGLIIGLGCGGLALLSVIGGAVLFVALRSAAPPPPPAHVTPSKGAAGPIGGPTTTVTLKAELRDLRDFKSEFGKSRHFVGELHNTGTESLGFPSAKVTFYDASNTAIDSSICATLVRVLPPGEKIPCTFSTLKADGYVTFKSEVTPMRSFFKGSIPDLKVSEIKFIPKAGYNPHTLEGRVTNNSGFKAKTVWALVSLYGADGKICGAEQTLVAGSDLDAGQAALFSAKIYNVAAKPETYTVKAVGYSD
jgi:hypothetical protein